MRGRRRRRWWWCGSGPSHPNNNGGAAGGGGGAPPISGGGSTTPTASRRSGGSGSRQRLFLRRVLVVSLGTIAVSTLLLRQLHVLNKNGFLQSSYYYDDDGDGNDAAAIPGSYRGGRSSDPIPWIFLAANSPSRSSSSSIVVGTEAKKEEQEGAAESESEAAASSSSTDVVVRPRRRGGGKAGATTTTAGDDEEDGDTYVQEVEEIADEGERDEGDEESDLGSKQDQDVDSGEDDDKDKDCIFRHSKLYRKIYVYPDPGTDQYSGSILSDAAREALAKTKKEQTKKAPSNDSNSTSSPHWPWISYGNKAQRERLFHYDFSTDGPQYDTELLVRELMTHPNSCLRTNDPETALLFYVPYMPSLEEAGRKYAAPTYEEKTKTVQSPYGTALLDVIVRHNYTGWESPDLFGFTSEYWKRRNGSDHILVYSEPLHGLFHNPVGRGSYHFVNTQVQLHPPIAVGVELTQTFVKMHPLCARKNILVPYPNPDGRWFNGEYGRQVDDMLQTFWDQKKGRTGNAQPQPKQQQRFDLDRDHYDSTFRRRQQRLATMFYKAGYKGRCRELRRVIKDDYESCSQSYRNYHYNFTTKYWHGMRISTFCPAPIGDSPSAKRMYDCLHAGSIPVILSNDFVWPFTTDMIGPNSSRGNGFGLGGGRIISPDEFSVRFDTTDFKEPTVNHTTCQLLNESRPSLEDRLAAIPLEKVRKWQSALQRMSDQYSWYKRGPDLPENPLAEGRMPDGELARRFVRMLEERSDGSLWAACRDELAEQAQLRPKLVEPRNFLC